MQNKPAGGEEESLSVESGAVTFGIIDIAPNPATSKIKVNINGVKKGAVSMRIFEMSGKLVTTKEVSAAAGIQYVLVDISDLPIGMHILEAANNGYSSRSKFIKQ